MSAQELPDALEADISHLEIGDVLTVGDLVVPEGVEVLTPAEDVVVSILAPQVEEPEEEAEEAAEKGHRRLPRSRLLKREKSKEQGAGRMKLIAGLGIPVLNMPGPATMWVSGWWNYWPGSGHPHQPVPARTLWSRPPG